MRARLKGCMRRWRTDESGNATVEFVIMVPVFISLLTMSIELGLITLRETMMERGLDMAVRQIRLGTGDPGTYAEIKSVLCENALVFADCENNLRLEMQPVNPRAYASLDPEVKCTENAEPVDPETIDKEYVPGGSNTLMVLRACFRYDPFFPDAVLGRALQKDGFGQPAIIATTAFVQEPT